MPIIEMCDADAPGARLVEHGTGDHKVYTRLTHVGLCIRDYERNGYDDSDFYMVVWDEAAQQPRHICFASTRGWSYPCYGSSADATPEVMAKYNAWEAARRQQALADKAAMEERLPKRGRQVELIRKVRGKASHRLTVGATYEVGWYGRSQFGAGRWSSGDWKVGLRVDDGQQGYVFVAADAVRVVGSDQSAAEALLQAEAQNRVAAVVGGYSVDI